MANMRENSQNTFVEEKFLAAIPEFDGTNYKRFNLILQYYIDKCAGDKDDLEFVYDTVLDKLVGRPLDIALQCRTLDELLNRFEEAFDETQDPETILRDIKLLSMDIYPEVQDYSDVMDDKIMEYFAAVKKSEPLTECTNSYYKDFSHNQFLRVYFDGLSNVIRDRIQFSDLKTFAQAREVALAKEKELGEAYAKIFVETNSMESKLSQLLELHGIDSAKLEFNMVADSKKTKNKVFCGICKTSSHDLEVCRFNPNNIICKVCRRNGHYTKYCFFRRSNRRRYN